MPETQKLGEKIEKNEARVVKAGLLFCPADISPDGGRSNQARKRVSPALRWTKKLSGPIIQIEGWNARKLTGVIGNQRDS